MEGAGEGGGQDVGLLVVEEARGGVEALALGGGKGVGGEGIAWKEDLDGHRGSQSRIWCIGFRITWRGRWVLMGRLNRGTVARIKDVENDDLAEVCGHEIWTIVAIRW